LEIKVKTARKTKGIVGDKGLTGEKVKSETKEVHLVIESRTFTG